MMTNLILIALPPEHDTRRLRLGSVSISRLCSECQLWSNSNHFQIADSDLVSSLLLLLFTMPRYVCPVQGYFENFLVCNYGPSANIWKVKRLSLKDTCTVLCQDTSFCIDLSTDCPDCQDPVYDIAETTCDCPCVDCDQEEGMCPSDPRWMALSNLKSSW